MTGGDAGDADIYNENDPQIKAAVERLRHAVEEAAYDPAEIDRLTHKWYWTAAKEYMRRLADNDFSINQEQGWAPRTVVAALMTKTNRQAHTAMFRRPMPPTEPQDINTEERQSQEATGVTPEDPSSARARREGQLTFSSTFLPTPHYVDKMDISGAIAPGQRAGGYWVAASPSISLKHGMFRPNLGVGSAPNQFEGPQPSSSSNATDPYVQPLAMTICESASVLGSSGGGVEAFVREPSAANASAPLGSILREKWTQLSDVADASVGESVRRVNDGELQVRMARKGRGCASCRDNMLRGDRPNPI